MYLRVTPREPRSCPECGTGFVSARSEAITCSPRCRKLRHRYSRARAERSAVPLDAELAAIEKALIVELDRL